MSADEQAAFEAGLQHDDQLRAKFEEARLLFTGIAEAGLKDKLPAFHQNVPAGTATKPRRFGWIRIAAAAAVLVVVAALFLSRTPEHEKIYADFYEADPGLSTAMGTTDDYAFHRGMIDYKTGNYAGAIEQWRPLLTASPASDTLNYYTGLAFLGMKKTDSTTYYLQRVAALSGSAFQQEARWYQALALIRENRKEEAIRVLEQANHPGKEKLLSRLK